MKPGVVCSSGTVVARQTGRFDTYGYTHVLAAIRERESDDCASVVFGPKLDHHALRAYAELSGPGVRASSGPVFGMSPERGGRTLRVSAATLTFVGDEMEAEALCGLLRTNGIKCSYRRSNMSAGAVTYGAGNAIAGPTEVLVDQNDLEAARKLIKG